MSKVISFSISDRYLDKLRTLYPSLTDNLAVKKFLTDRLDDSLGNSLDDSLDGILDERTKTLIESWVDGLLEVRLDATVGKSVSDLSERLSRLESRLDDSLDGRLDDIMEQLLKREKECLIATSPIPPGEPSPLPPSPDEPGEPATAIEDSQKKILETVKGSESLDTLPVPTDEPGEDAIASIDGTVETVEPISTIETVASAIEKTQSEIARLLGVHSSTVTRWKQNKAIPSEYLDKCQFNDDKSKILWIYDRI